MQEYKTQTWYKLAKSSIARVLRSMRTIEDLTQAELSENIGTAQSGISDLEKGNIDPGVSTIFRYAEACGFDVQLIITRKQGLPIGAKFVLSSEDFRK